MTRGKSGIGYFAVLVVFALIIPFVATCGDEDGEDQSFGHSDSSESADHGPVTTHFEMIEGMRLGAVNQSQRFGLTFDENGVLLNSIGRTEWWWNYELAGIGRGDDLTKPSPVEIFVTQCSDQGEQIDPEGCIPTVDYKRDGFTEWYANSDNGLIQGFVIDSVPDGNGLLKIEGRVDTTLNPRQSESAVHFFANSENILKYFDLAVFDAAGTALDAWIEFVPDEKFEDGISGTMRILVDDSVAAHPLLIRAGATIRSAGPPEPVGHKTTCSSDPDCDDGNDCTDDECTGIGSHDETVGATTINNSGYSRTRGNYFECTASSTFTGTAMWISLSATTSITAGIWESNTLTGSYTLIDSIQTSITNNGTNWNTISGFSTPLQAGKYYAIGFSWGSSRIVGYYYGNVGDQTVAFGTRKGYLEKNSFLPGSFTAGSLADNIIGARQRIMTTGGNGTCSYTNNTDPCNDGTYCNGTDTCSGGLCNQHAGNPCTDDGLYCNGTESCNEGTDSCDHSGNPCADDGIYCNGAETCNEGSDSCGHAGNPCTDDGLYCNGTESCNEGTDSCDHSGNPCTDDGIYCNGAETCNEGSDSCGHAGNPCTDDGAFCNGNESCNEGTDSCDHSGNPCTDDGVYCNGIETCNEASDTCGHSGDPCTDDGAFCNGNESCNEGTDSCDHSGNPCGDDGLFCNGTESCNEANDTCDHSGSPCTDDGVFCNGSETCDEATDTCGHAGDPCSDDGLFCNGSESCNEANDTCDHSGNPCTDDGVFCNGSETCNESNDSCGHSGNPCADDGLFCNGTESCDEVNDQCDHSGNPCSDDGIYCNGTENCNESSDTCQHSGNPCPDDSLFCNGAESCDETYDQCETTGYPCDPFTETCNETTDSCDPITDDDDDDDTTDDDDNDTGDDDDAGDDDDTDCINCSDTGQCLEALGQGWICMNGCCEQVGDDDDQALDDDDQASATDDDDDSSGGCCSG